MKRRRCWILNRGVSCMSVDEAIMEPSEIPCTQAPTGVGRGWGVREADEARVFVRLADEGCISIIRQRHRKALAGTKELLAPVPTSLGIPPVFRGLIEDLRWLCES
jgi:hypothetical protein